MLPILACAPLVLIFLGWCSLALSYPLRRAKRLSLIALSIGSANAAFASGNYAYYRVHPLAQFLPSWKDPQTLSYGLLFLSAPAAIITGCLAIERAGPKPMLFLVILASVPLCILGLFAVGAV